LSNVDSHFLVAACEKLKLSARGFYRVKKIARTIGDLYAVERVGQRHLAEALSYRSI
jgi:magnesium chelatase family protein